MAFLLVSAARTPTNAALLDAARRLGLEPSLVAPAEIARVARAGDVALARLDIAPTLDGVEDGIWELGRLEADGVRVLNSPASLLATHDKLATAIRLGREGIPHPRTAQVDEESDPVDLELPVVVKPRFGSWGRDVFLCHTRRELGRCLGELAGRPWFRRQGALLQELVPPLGRDLRLVIAGGDVVGAVERHAAPGEWRTNIALGARRIPTDPPANARAVARAAAAAVGTDLVGVDMLPARDGGWVVVELNGAVDFTIEYSLDGRDAFEAAVSALGLTPAFPVAASA